MCPVNQPLIPLVHPPELNAVTQSDGYPLCDVYIVGDEERLPISDFEDKALVPRSVAIVRQKTVDASRRLDPGAVVLFVENRYQITLLPAPS